jgi:hypothetical protein
MLATIKDAQIIELDRGAAAKGLTQIWNLLTGQNNNGGISFFTSRPWQRRQQTGDRGASAERTAPTRPTHLLYRSIAYPITEKPLTIGSAHDGRQNDITISEETVGVSPKHCTVEFQGGQPILKNVSEQGTFVDEKRVDRSTTLELGQIIRVGSPGEHLQLIACVNTLTKK